MRKLKDLFPTKEEARKLVLEFWKQMLLVVLAGAALLVPTARDWLANRAKDFCALASHDVLIPGWLAIAFALCALFTVVEFARLLVIRLRPAHVRLFSSLSSDEQKILTLLAQSEFGLTEGQLCDLVSAPSQRFLYFIDHLVNELGLVERTEQYNGGAFWALSDQGRNLAAAMKLFSG